MYLPNTALIHPHAVYMSKPGRPRRPDSPLLSPKGVTALCNAGPTIKPKTCANDMTLTAPVRSDSLVAALT